jgi:hypothetical protein
MNHAANPNPVREQIMNKNRAQQIAAAALIAMPFLRAAAEARVGDDPPSRWPQMSSLRSSPGPEHDAATRMFQCVPCMEVAPCGKQLRRLAVGLPALHVALSSAWTRSPSAFDAGDVWLE